MARGGDRGRIAVIGTGVANTASVCAAFARMGMEAFVTADAGAVEGERLVCLPGVGAFGAGMAFLRDEGLRDRLAARIGAGRATLAVCLGMQLLGSSSEETAGVGGLDVVRARAERFGDGVMVPHFGWNVVEPDAGFGLAGRGHAYFANSYRFVDAPAGWSAAWCEHGGRFVAAVRRGDVLACQFHPELSGAWGAGLLRAWVRSCGVEVGEAVAAGAEGGASC